MNDFRTQAVLHQQLATKLEEAAAIEDQIGTAAVATAPKAKAKAAPAKSGAKRGRPKGSKNTVKAPAAKAPKTTKTTKTGQGRRNGTKSMKDMVVAALTGKKEGLVLPEIVTSILASGYETKAKSPVDVVYQAVYKLMKDDNVADDQKVVKEGKCYKLAKAA